MTQDLTLRDVNGASIPLADFQDPPTFLVFFTPSCDACRQMTEKFRAWPNALPDGFDLQPVFVGSPADFSTAVEFVPLLEHAWYDDGSVADAVGADPTPAAVLIDADHPVGAGAGYGAPAIQEMVVRPGFWQEPEAKEAAAQWKADLGATLMKSARQRPAAGWAPKVTFRGKSKD